MPYAIRSLKQFASLPTGPELSHTGGRGPENFNSQVLAALPSSIGLCSPVDLAVYMILTVPRELCGEQGTAWECQRVPVYKDT